MKKICIITVGEIIPELGDKGSMMRSSILSKKLANHHDVTYVTNDFNHFLKKRRFNKFEIIKKKIRYISISAINYHKNISILRLLHHFQFSIKLFFFLIKNNFDLVICSYPTVENLFVCNFVKYFKKFKMIIDIRDKWPDIFSIINTKNIFLIWYVSLNKFINKQIFKKNSVVTISEDFKNWSQIYTDKEVKIFPLSTNNKRQTNSLICKSNKTINFWFIGSLGSSYELKNLIRAFNIKKDRNIKLFITGDGEKYSFLKKISNLKNIYFTGWLGEKDLKNLSVEMDIGVMPYALNATQGLPNKLFDYFGFGLPVICTLKGDLSNLRQKKIGWNFYNNTYDALKVIDRVIKDKREINKMKTVVISKFRKHFEHNKVYLSYKKYIETLL